MAAPRSERPPCPCHVDSDSEHEAYPEGAPHPNAEAPWHRRFSEVLLRRTKSELAEARHENHHLKHQKHHLEGRFQEIKKAHRKVKKSVVALENRAFPRITDLKEILRESKLSQQEALRQAEEWRALVEQEEKEQERLKAIHFAELDRVTSAKRLQEETSQKLARKVEELEALLRKAVVDLSKAEDVCQACHQASLDQLRCAGCADAKPAPPVEVFVCLPGSDPCVPNQLPS
ncbi:unnamed protein product [Durusdinium trenchii]|uniref:RAB6-interacting golgin n=1 Tax=Durusdinium trenchii TaxID=1381693 RepID=A0ABP0RDZ1_9DINO